MQQLRSAEGAFKELRAAGYLPLAGKERENVALMPAMGAAHRTRHFRGTVAGVEVLAIHYLHFIHAPRSVYVGSVEPGAKRRGVDRGRHHDDPEVRAHHVLRLASERESHIGGKAALVIFIENHGAYPFERRVVDEHALENAFGDHQNPGGVGDPALEPHTVADGEPYRLAEHRGHAFGHLPGRKTPGLEHDDAPPGERLENRERQQRGLAGTRGSRDHKTRHLLQRGVDLAGYRCHRQLAVGVGDFHLQRKITIFPPQRQVFPHE